MEYGTIERDLHIDAAPEVVFEVVSSPEHIRDWWNAETDLEPAPGATGVLRWHDEATARTDTVPITIVDVVPPRLFSFRWVYAEGEVATSANSLLVIFELSASGSGTLLRLTEVGFRTRGWDAAVLEAHYREHGQGWDFYLPRLGQCVRRLVSAR